MDKEEKLRKLGLSDKEAVIYVKALESGVFSASGISARTGIKRPTCYLILSDLIEKGLIISVPRAKKALFTAEDPEKILRQVQENLSLAEKLIPELKMIRKSENQDPFVKYYSGQKGVHAIFEDILKCKEKKYSFIGSGKDVIEITGKDFIDDWLIKRVNKNIQSVSIRMKKTENEENFYQNQPMQELKLAPENIHIPETIFIYDDKVAIISTTKENFGFVVNSQDFSETMRGLFTALWSISNYK